ncbi:ChaN family lipoprotein [Sulfurimonas sp. MAG313]|nr:ChaN family lipoprotein [Sulfurimonas sp. MAG313]MDF1880624.1 ChaN family lipoprotein [Sulfurimonas sp. MAG313]
MLRKNIHLPFFLVIFIFLSACSTPQLSIVHPLKQDCQYYSLKAAQCKTEKQIIKALDPYKVIFIGDHHTQDTLHLNISKLIAGLSKNGTKVILANEWFYPTDNIILDKYTSNEDNTSQFIKNIRWKERMKFYKYESFGTIYKAVKDNGGTLRGINLSKEERKKISDQNLSRMTQKELNFYHNIDLKVSPHKQQVMPFLSHCHAPKSNESLQECSQRMYKVQVAWDTKMALESYKLLLDLKDNEKLIIFAGAMHIENKLGIPLRFSRLSNEPFVTIIPVEVNDKEIEHQIGDYVLFYESPLQEEKE